MKGREAALTVALAGPTARLPAWYFWPDSEVHVFLGVAGLRVGVSPAQLVDFLAGIFGLDPLGDDVKEGPPAEPEPAPARAANGETR